MNIKKIASLLTEDPNVFNKVINEESSVYDAEEVVIPPQFVPPTARTGHPEGEMIGIEFIYEWDFHKGEPMVRYYSDGSGYPGSPDYHEVTDVQVKGVYGENGPIPLTPELNKWCLNWFQENEDTIVSQEMESYEEPEPDYDRDDYADRYDY